MKIKHLSEPELEFGQGGKHLDIRFGLMNYGPVDYDPMKGARRIRVGFVGTPASIEGVLNWLTICKEGVAAKVSRYPNLFPRFPGFSPDSAYRAEIENDSRLQRSISNSAIKDLRKIGTFNDMIAAAADLYVSEARYLSEETNVDVIVCAVPSDLVDLIDRIDPITGAKKVGIIGGWQFHDVLKAKAMAVGKPIQMVRPSTYAIEKPHKKAQRGQKSTRLQDSATIAWNFYTALYYKAHGVPWRIERRNSELTTCHIGISFYQAADRSRVNTSMAQVFNQRGQGVIVRGPKAHVSKDDRTLHLSEGDSHQLLLNALKTYRLEHHNFPARVVIHKSSSYDESERVGFKAAAQKLFISSCDLTYVRESYTRLFRGGYYAPLRGTLLELDYRNLLLYTRGSVEFFATYPGLYVPMPLEIVCEDVEQSPEYLALEVLSLTKTNWNNTQFDGKWPITLLAAKKVGSILKHLSTSDPYQPHYGFYM